MRSFTMNNKYKLDLSSLNKRAVFTNTLQLSLLICISIKKQNFMCYESVYQTHKSNDRL